MTDLYLKFTDQSQAESVLYDFTEFYVDEQGSVVQPDEQGNYSEGTTVKTEKRNKYLNTDVIGTIYKPTGQVETVDGMEVPVMQALDGYHVNIRLMDNEDETPLVSYEVIPQNPVRVWYE